MAPFQVINIFRKRTSQTKVKPVTPETVWQEPLQFIAFGLGSGTISFAPGTCGTLMAIPFYICLQTLSPSTYIVFAFLFTLMSIWICDKVSKQIKVHDHPGIVIDEFAGFFVTMIHAPAGLIWILTGFLLFRLFDIWKPWPIKWLDKKVGGGFGIVIDDVVAGLFAFIVMQTSGWYFNG